LDYSTTQADLERRLKEAEERFQDLSRKFTANDNVSSSSVAIPSERSENTVMRTASLLAATSRTQSLRFCEVTSEAAHVEDQSAEAQREVLHHSMVASVALVDQSPQTLDDQISQQSQEKLKQQLLHYELQVVELSSALASQPSRNDLELETTFAAQSKANLSRAQSLHFSVVSSNALPELRTPELLTANVMSTAPAIAHQAHNEVWLFKKIALAIIILKQSILM
jgi:hypothetical protein